VLEIVYARMVVHIQWRIRENLDGVTIAPSWLWQSDQNSPGCKLHIAAFLGKSVTFSDSGSLTLQRPLNS
jgi:hypothetical protein